MANPLLSVKSIAVLAAVVLIAIGGVSYAFMGKSEPAPKTEMTSIEPVAGTEEEATQTELERLMSERFVGDANAPVVIQEFSSLTCGHCGNFHKNTYKQLKEQYIDTGKVKMVFRDFPLNAPALHASMVARCLPEARYERFIQILLENQEDWAYGVDYLKYLRQNAQLAGLSGAGFDACMKNEELQQAIVDSVQKAQDQYGISSTPAFVINETLQISGARGLDAFEEVIKPLLDGVPAP